jgi:hypothetical protein
MSIDMAFQEPFSKRNRYSGCAKEITICEDAPENLRYVVLQTAIDLSWAPTSHEKIRTSKRFLAKTQVS